MQKPTLRQNGKREVTFKVSFHLDIKELAILLLKQPEYQLQLLEQPEDYKIKIKSQKLFEEQIRNYLWEHGFIDEDFEFTEDELNAAIDAINNLYPNYEW